MATNPSLVVRVAANIAELKRNLAEGRTQIEITTAGMQKLANSLSGEKLIQNAHNIVAAVDKIGGVTKLTEAEKARLNATLDRALQKYAAIGKDAPAAMVALEQATRKAEEPTSILTAKMVALGSFIGTMAANAVAALGRMAIDGVRALGGEVAELITRGAKLSGISQSFETLAASVNATGAAMLGRMREGTRGLVADLDLMQAANKAVLLGLPVTADSMATLAQTAETLGRAMGLGPTQAFDDLITALGRSSPMILDNLGLTVKVGDANAAYARQIGKTAEQLSEADQKQAFYNATMAAAEAKIAALGEAHLTLGDRIQQAATWFQNFKDDLAVAIARSPVLNELLNETGLVLADVFGADSTGRVKTLIGVVNDLAVGLVDVAAVGIEVGQRVAQGMQFAHGVLQGIGAAVMNIVAAVASANAKLAEIAAGIPVIGKKWDESAVSARRHADEVAAVADGYALARDAAFDALGTTGVAFDNARARIEKMRVAVTAARDALAAQAETAVKQAAAEQANTLVTAAATAAKKRQAEALAELAVLGDGWKAVVSGMDPALVESIKKHLSLGGALHTVAAALGVSEDKVKAVAAAMADAATQTEIYNSGLTFTSKVVADAAGPALDAIAAKATTAAAAVQGITIAFQTAAEAMHAGLGEDIKALLREGYTVNEAFSLRYAQVYGMPSTVGTPPPGRPHVPGFADGVSGFRGGWAMVGERGPELLNLPRGSSVVPLDRPMAGVGGPPIVVNLHVGNFIGSDHSAARQLTDMVSAGVLQRLGSQRKLDAS